MLKYGYFLSSKRYFSSIRSRKTVIIVGGGHAGCEAAAASARTGAITKLVTQRIGNYAVYHYFIVNLSKNRYYW